MTGFAPPPISRRLVAAVVVVVVVANVATAAGCSRSADRSAPSQSLTAGADCAASRGSNVTTRRGQQQILVHLPPCYDEHATTRYPLIVLIHGAGADETQWTDIGTTTESDRLVGVDEIAPAIIVMPSFRDGSAAYEAEAVVDRVVPLIDATYRTLADPEHRAIGGISRGGGAALLAGSAHPELFGVVGAHSPAVSGDLDQIRDGLTALGGNIRLDVGRSDGLRDSIVGFVDSLERAGISVELHVDPGHHNRAYWRQHVADYLRFYAARWR